jgi:hypothetical protein
MSRPVPGLTHYCRTMEAFLVAAGLFGALLGCVGLVRDASRPTQRRRTLGLVALLLFSMGSASWFWAQHRLITDMEHDAARLVAKWHPGGLGDDPYDLSSKGLPELEGIVLGGLAFLEQHKGRLGETFRQAREIYRSQVLQYRPDVPTESLSPQLEADQEFRERLERAAGAMIGVVGSIAEE